jgi:Flp pilus assembly protein TadD
LLEGKRLLEEHQYPQAVERLRAATVLLGTNAPPHYRAQAWNYLGVACHQGSLLGEAEKAYRRAILFD